MASSPEDSPVISEELRKTYEQAFEQLYGGKEDYPTVYPIEFCGLPFETIIDILSTKTKTTAADPTEPLIPPSYKGMPWESLSSDQRREVVCAWAELYEIQGDIIDEYKYLYEAKGPTEAAAGAVRVAAGGSPSPESRNPPTTNDDRCRLLHMLADPALTMFWSGTYQSDNRDYYWGTLCENFNKYEDMGVGIMGQSIYENAIYEDDDIKFQCATTTPIKDWNPQNGNRPFRGVSWMQTQLKTFQTDFAVYKQRWDNAGRRERAKDVETYWANVRSEGSNQIKEVETFKDECHGDYMALYAFMRWGWSIKTLLPMLDRLVPKPKPSKAASKRTGSAKPTKSKAEAKRARST